MSHFIHQDGEAYGPYTIEQLRCMWAAAQITGDTLYREEGYNDWLPLRVLVDELQLPTQPPIILRPPVIPHAPRPLIAQRKSGAGVWLVGGLIVVGAVALFAFFGSLISTDDNTITEKYARYINAFADKH